MKYIVGYPITENENFINEIINNKSHIEEVYFSWGDMPNGRSALTKNGSTPFETLTRQVNDLKKLSDNGIKLNLLFNANCYGKDSQSREFFNSIGDLIDYIKTNFNLNSITTSSPLIAKFVKGNFEGVDVRASVNMEIGSIEGISYLKDYFDSFYVKRELNRNLPALLKLKKWCDENGKTMYLLANSGCLNNCSAHTFHDNLVAHEKEISKMDNGYQFKGICWEHLSTNYGKETWLQRTNFIRPEDISLYESITPAVKLATRVNSSPTRVLNAYINGGYKGSVMEILEPNHSGAFYPSFAENSNFPSDYAKRVLNCNKDCENCNYCKEILKKVLITLPEDTSMKV